MPDKGCVNAAAYYIKDLYKIREYTMVKKKRNGWKILVFEIVLSVCGQEVKCSKKAVGVF